MVFWAQGWLELSDGCGGNGLQPSNSKQVSCHPRARAPGVHASITRQKYISVQGKIIPIAEKP